jgi:cysteinyl-tRNA synthetase
MGQLLSTPNTCILKDSSKSLKEVHYLHSRALENNSARQIRLLFFVAQYNATHGFRNNTMGHSVITEEAVCGILSQYQGYSLRQYGMKES